MTDKLNKYSLFIRNFPLTSRLYVFVRTLINRCNPVWFSRRLSLGIVFVNADDSCFHHFWVHIKDDSDSQWCFYLFKADESCRTTVANTKPSMEIPIRAYKSLFNRIALEVVFLKSPSRRIYEKKTYHSRKSMYTCMNAFVISLCFLYFGKSREEKFDPSLVCDKDTDLAPHCCQAKIVH